MGEIRVLRRHEQDCPGCLGAGTCWVCLGTGRLPDGLANKPCHRCNGTAACQEQPGTVTLPEQRAFA